ncbi:hypothetical protein JCM11641_005125, partial [Rhodosporidiobolus odoratus]
MARGRTFFPKQSRDLSSALLQVRRIAHSLSKHPHTTLAALRTCPSRSIPRMAGTGGGGSQQSPRLLPTLCRTWSRRNPKNHFLQLLWPALRLRLVPLLRAASTLGHFPSSWKDAVGIVLRKPKKPDYANPKAYRLIAFERTLAKVLEKVIARRLAYLEDNRGLEASQHFGGSRARAAEDAVVCAVDTIKRQHRKGNVVIGVALDVTSAFPSVKPTVLDRDLEARGLPTGPRRLIASWLENRTCTLHLGRENTGREKQDGLPQGSPLSPAAFKVYNSGAVEACESDQSTCYGWIDDLNLFAWGKNVETVVSAVNKNLMPQLEDWSRTHSSSFEPLKTVVVLFLPPQTAEPLAPLPPVILCEVEANLIPLNLRFRRSLFRLAFRAHSAVAPNPLHSRSKIARIETHRKYPSPLHTALHAFPSILPPTSMVEPLLPLPVAPWEAPPAVKLSIAPSREEAIQAHQDLVARLSSADCALTYSDGSLKEGVLGAGALVVVRCSGVEGEIERSEGMGRGRTVYEGKPQGAKEGLGATIPILSTATISPIPAIYILADDQSALRNLVDPSPTPGQQILLDLRSLLLGLNRTHPSTLIHLQWCPGHEGIDGNERADQLANAAVDRELEREKEVMDRRSKVRRRAMVGRTVRTYRKGMEDEDSSAGDDGEWDGAHETSTQLAKRIPTLPSSPSPSLPLSLSALRQQHEALIQTEWATQWSTGTT